MADDITNDLALLDDWLAGKGYGEEAGLCMRAMDLIRKQADEIEKLRAENERTYLSVFGEAVEQIDFAVTDKSEKQKKYIAELEAENEKLRANFQVLADAVRVAKDAASYNRHKNEHCVSRSIWSALSDQEKYARKVLSDFRAAKAALGESDE